MTNYFNLDLTISIINYLINNSLNLLIFKLLISFYEFNKVIINLFNSNFESNLINQNFNFFIILFIIDIINLFIIDIIIHLYLDEYF